MVKEQKDFSFDQDEKVLCYHGPFIYEAKVHMFYTSRIHINVSI